MTCPVFEERVSDRTGGAGGEVGTYGAFPLADAGDVANQLIGVVIAERIPGV